MDRRLAKADFKILTVPDTRLGPASNLGGANMKKRRHYKQTSSLLDRLAVEAERLRSEAKLRPPGPVRDEVLRKLRQAETASHLTEWINSPGLRSPS